MLESKFVFQSIDLARGGITPGVLPFALRAALRAFKSLPAV